MEGGIGKIWKNNHGPGPWLSVALICFLRGGLVVSLHRGYFPLLSGARRSPWHDSAPRVPSLVPPPPGSVPGRAADRSGARCRAAAGPCRAVLGGGCRSGAGWQRLTVLLAEAGCRAVLGGDWVPSCPAGPGTVACSIMIAVRDRPDQRSAPAKFPCIIICISLHILSESAYKMHGK
jgi:hypothetical protein